jgi:hypothetical protein
MADKPEKKNKKVSKMSVSEIESALKKAKENNNTDTSRYVMHLSRRKQELQVGK